MKNSRAGHPDKKDIPKGTTDRKESEAILAALSCDIEDLKKASLALKHEVYQDISLIAGLKNMIEDSSNAMQNIVLQVSKLSTLNSHSPIILLFVVVLLMLLTLYIATKL